VGGGEVGSEIFGGYFGCEIFGGEGGCGLNENSCCCGLTFWRECGILGGGKGGSQLEYCSSAGRGDKIMRTKTYRDSFGTIELVAPGERRTKRKYYLFNKCLNGVTRRGRQLVEQEADVCVESDVGTVLWRNTWKDIAFVEERYER
jgi:hypothetical protein